MQHVVEPGQFPIFAGTNSVELEPATLWVQAVS